MRSTFYLYCSSWGRLHEKFCSLILVSIFCPDVIICGLSEGIYGIFPNIGFVCRRISWQQASINFKYNFFILFIFKSHPQAHCVVKFYIYCCIFFFFFCGVRGLPPIFFFFFSLATSRLVRGYQQEKVYLNFLLPVSMFWWEVIFDWWWRSDLILIEMRFDSI